MKVIANENTVYIDVDGTLVLPPSDSSSDYHVKVYDPIEDKLVRLRVHEPMVRLLKEEYARGSYVTVWSRGGHAWAESVVKALGIKHCVHQVMSKPMSYFDDLPIEEWLRYRVFLSPDTPYKK